MRILDEGKLHEFSEVTLKFANKMITDDFVNWGGMIQKDSPDLRCALEMGYENMFVFAQRFVSRDELIDDIYVHEGKQITIKFKYEDEYQKAIDYIRRNENITLLRNDEKIG